MAVSLAKKAPACLTDDLVVGFEASFEAICAVEDDRDAIEHAVRGLQQLHAQTARLSRHLYDRLQRITDVVLPELHGSASTLDARLTARTASRRRNGSVHL